MSELEFRDELASLGVEPYVAEWAAGHYNAEHAHDFTARGFVLTGGLILNLEGKDHHLSAGSTFLVNAGTPHSERVGSAGATVLAGRLPAAS